MSKDVAAFILLIVTFPAPVLADTVIDFQEIAPGNYSSATSHGFNFFNPISGFSILSDGSNSYLALRPGPFRNGALVMFRDGFLPFDVVQMDFSRLVTTNPPFDFVNLFASFYGGGFQSLIIPGVNSPTFETFNIGLTNLQYLTVTPWDIEIDNIVTHVPEYSTLGLLIIGLFLVAGQRRVTLGHATARKERTKAD